MSISEEHFDLLADQLTNNDVNDDSSLKDFLIGEGVPSDYVDQALVLRPEFLVNPFAKLVLVDGQLNVETIRVRGVGQ